MPSSILFIAASLIWGSTFWAITLQLGEVSPAVSIVYRFALASSVLFGWCLLRGEKLRLSWAAQRWTILQGCCSFGLSYIGTYFAEQYVVSALVAVLFALMVFWNPILSRIAFGTPLTWRTWAQAVGHDPAVGRASDRSLLRFNHYTDTIEAAVNGERVALGWSMLLANHLREGRLVRLGTHVLDTEDHYCLLVSDRQENREAGGIFTDWMAAELARASEA